LPCSTTRCRTSAGTPDELRARLAVQWLEWRYAHDSGAGMDTSDKDPSDKDPQQYIAEHR
jgi:hypothetical protein